MSAVCNFDTDLTNASARWRLTLWTSDRMPFCTDLTKCTSNMLFDTYDVKLYAIFALIWQKHTNKATFYTENVRLYAIFALIWQKTRQQGDVWHWERRTVCNFDTDLTICTNKVRFDTANVRLYAILAMIWQKCSFDTDVRLYRWRLNRLYAILTL